MKTPLMLTPRLRRLLGMLLAVLLAGTWWTWALQPAWQTWRDFPQRQLQLQTQTGQIRAQQAIAQQLQARPTRPTMTRAQAMALVQAESPRLLGNGTSVQAQGDLLLVRVSGARAEDLARWLSLMREQAASTPDSAQLRRVPGAADRWQGQLLLRLP